MNITNQRKQPQDIFLVKWVGKDNSFLYEKRFSTYDDALTFSKTVKYGIVCKAKKGTQDTMQYEIVPTVSARELVKAIKIHKKLDKKSQFYNADGITEIQSVTTTQLRSSQNARLISMLLFTPVIIYAGTRKELPKWLRYSLFTIAGLSFISNYSNYSMNKNLDKDLETEDQEL